MIKIDLESPYKSEIGDILRESDKLLGEMCVKEGSLHDAPRIYCPNCGHTDRRFRKKADVGVASGQRLKCFKCKKQFMINVHIKYTSFKTRD